MGSNACTRGEWWRGKSGRRGEKNGVVENCTTKKYRFSVAMLTLVFQKRGSIFINKISSLGTNVNMSSLTLDFEKTDVLKW